MENKKPTQKKVDLDKIDFLREIIMTFSNKSSLFSSKKIERAIVFIVTFVITIVYLVKNMSTLSSMDFIQVIGLWLTYAGWNTAMNYRDKKMDSTKSVDIDNPDE